MLLTSSLDALAALQVESEDFNPLKPCGSCSEWLKKIAEVNPAFKVLSFTDSNVKARLPARPVKLNVLL